MENFFSILRKYQNTVRFYLMLMFKVVTFFYILYIVHNGIKISTDNIEEVIALLIGGGFLIVPIKSR